MSTQVGARRVGARTAGYEIGQSHGEIERLYVWDLVVRVTHWTIVASVLVLSVTGLYIGNPFVIPSTSTPSFLMGWMRAIHFATAGVFTAAVLARLIWMFTGTPYARWRNFIPVTRKRFAQIPDTLRFYLFMRRMPPPEVGHYTISGLTYTAVFLLHVMLITTGLGMYAVNAHIESPLRALEPLLGWFGGAQGARWLHHLGMWLLLGFVINHVYSAILVSRVEKNGEIDSIFSGYKWLSREEEGSDQR